MAVAFRAQRKLVPPPTPSRVGREAAERRPLAFSARTYVFVDGFNLYHGCLQHTEFKWLDLGKLATRLLPSGFELKRVFYYAARVRGFPHDPDAPRRQEIYLRLLHTFRQECDAALIVSNDSDLLEPLRIVRRELGMPVGVASPYPRASRTLLREASFFRSIRPGVLRASRFPPRLVDAVGTIRKPAAW